MQTTATVHIDDDHSITGYPLTPRKLLRTIAQEKITFFALLAIGILCTIAAVIFLPRYYTAKTIIIPPQQQQNSTAGALAQLGGVLSGGLGVGAMIKSNDDMYVALFKTNRVQDALIKRFDLQHRYQEDTLEGTRRRLSELTSVNSDKKTGLITLEVSDSDAAFSANLANAHIQELRQVLTSLAVTEAQQRRAFFEVQTSKVKNSLNAAEMNFRTLQKQSGLVLSQALAETGVRESAAIRAQILAKEVELKAIQKFNTDDHPNSIRIRTELSALKERLAQNEGGYGKSPSLNSETTSEKGLLAVQAFRDMKVQEALLEAYIRQLEIARSDEAREGPALQQVDIATPPEFQTKPKRSVIALTGWLITLFVAIFITAIKAGYRNIL